MGLLDDAIREHLELKRLKGAGLQEIARDEREALGPGSEVAPNGELSEGAHHQPQADEGAPQMGVSSAEAPAAPVPGRGQETVELDMDTVLGEEKGYGQSEEHGEPAVDDPKDLSPRGSGSQDSFEWEVPGEAGDAVEGTEGDRDGEGSEEPLEDVLEETPDFLRETPEQDRLWFEQRPPRDFDFDE